MTDRRTRRAFTLVELLVALVIMGVGAAGLAGAFVGDHHLRDLAAAHEFAAAMLRERLERLASLPCPAVESGASATASGSEHWRAASSPLAWSLTDSLWLGRSAAPLVLEARVACPD